MASEIKVDTIVNAGGDNDSGIDLSTNDVVAVKTANTQRMQVDASGRLKIGTTSNTPASAGTAGFVFGDNTAGTAKAGVASFVADGASPLLLTRLSSDGNILGLAKDGSTKGIIGTNAGFVQMYSTTSGCGGIQHNNNGSIPINNSGTATDNTRDLGQSNYRWDDVYATNGTIQTSDQNEKQDIASATAKELNVAKKLSALFKTFKWKDKVTEKGDKARTHTGIIAQEVQSAFSAEGLDASNYGLFTSDTWTDDDGKEQTRLGVRYPELFSFIFSSIEARLTALESK